MWSQVTKIRPTWCKGCWFLWGLPTSPVGLAFTGHSSPLLVCPYVWQFRHNSAFHLFWSLEKETLFYLGLSYYPLLGILTSKWWHLSTLPTEFLFLIWNSFSIQKNVENKRIFALALFSNVRTHHEIHSPQRHHVHSHPQLFYLRHSVECLASL